MKAINLLSGICSKVLAVIVLSAICAFPSRLTAQLPFTCTDTTYYQVDSNELYSYNPEGTRTLLHALTGDLNAIGYNVKDNLIWGYDRIAEQLFSLGSDGEISRFTIPNLVPTFLYKFNVGTCDTNGYLYLYEKDATEYYTIDIDTSRDTYLKLVDPLADFEEKTMAPWSTATSARTISDWAFNPTDGMIYALTDGIAGSPFHIMQLDPLTGVSTILSGAVTGDGVQDGGNPWQAYGSCFFDIEGNFLVFGNVNGHLFLVDIDTKLATRVTETGTPTNSNDGAFCPVAFYSPLPVTLLFFEVEKYNEKSILKWATASEQNSKGFGIERSPDGQHWSTISFVATLAEDENSATPLAYAFTDNSPLVGINFYRLKQVDIDGSYEYSEVRMVRFGQQGHLTILPDPANGTFIISGFAKGNNQIMLVNALGQVLLNTNLKDQAEYRLDLSRFTAGIYYISVRNEDGTVSHHKVVKQ